jgi:hypothetical protein
MDQYAIYAYAAGIIDGEGTVGLSRSKPNENRSPNVTVPNCTKGLIDFMHNVFGGTVSTKRTYKPDQSPSWVWSIRGDAALRFLSKALRFMQHPEKVRRASMLTTEYKGLTPRNGKYTLDQKIAKREFESRFFKYAR